ncbi:MAG: 16S rRNA (cytidine(1402)-2'-O)-methyltransferase [Roseiflexaceae bacterium]
MGTLYLVSTPIGNLEDITLRALRVLREASLIAAEDTRHTHRMLARYEIATPCIAYHEHNKLARLDDVLTALASGDVALVSDAGTPAMSDPGFELVGACIAAGFAVVPIPGPSAPIAALVAAGLPTDQFTYLGFLPRKGPDRRALLHSLADMPQTLVCFEAPHRIADALEDMLAILGDRRIVVARELTKPHEEFRRERISQVLAHFTAHRPRGEFTLVVAGRGLRPRSRPHDQVGAPGAPDEEPGPSEAEVAARLRALRDQGKSGSAAARQIARDLGISKSIVYQIWISLDDKPEPRTEN